MLSFIFALYSFIEYLKYDNPNIVYSRVNDETTKRAIFIRDTPILIKIIDTKNNEKINDSISYYDGDYIAIYENCSFFKELLIIEKCEYGKNIQDKYKKK